MEALWLSLDTKKAFDRCFHFATLKYIGFRGLFLQGIKPLRSKPLMLLLIYYLPFLIPTV